MRTRGGEEREMARDAKGARTGWDKKRRKIAIDREAWTFGGVTPGDEEGEEKILLVCEPFTHMGV